MYGHQEVGYTKQINLFFEIYLWRRGAGRRSSFFGAYILAFPEKILIFGRKTNFMPWRKTFSVYIV